MQPGPSVLLLPVQSGRDAAASIELLIGACLQSILRRCAHFASLMGFKCQFPHAAAQSQQQVPMWEQTVKYGKVFSSATAVKDDLAHHNTTEICLSYRTSKFGAGLGAAWMDIP